MSEIRFGLELHIKVIWIQFTKTSDLLLFTQRKQIESWLHQGTVSDSGHLVPTEHKFDLDMALLFAAAQLQRGFAFHSGKTQTESR